MAVAHHDNSREVRLHEIARRIRNEFMEMPGMHLTFAQVCRLWHLPQDDCERVLGQLVREQLLAMDSQRRFHLRNAVSPLSRTRHRRLERSA